MAFPIKLGARNGGNARVVRGLTSGVFRDAFVGSWWWIQNVKFGDVTLPGATSLGITLSATYPANPFPTNVDRGCPVIYVERPLAGGSISSATVILGDSGDDNGLVTSTSIFTGVSGYLPPNLSSGNPAAAEYAPRFESAFDPLLTLGSGGANLSAATDFSLWVMIEFSPVASV